MTTHCASQSRTVSRVGIGTIYDGGSEDLRIGPVSEISHTNCYSTRLTKTIFSHNTHPVKNAFPIATLMVLLNRQIYSRLVSSLGGNHSI